MEGIKMGGIRMRFDEVVAIFDLDGTLANIDHRLHHVRGEKKDWDRFYNEVSKDSFNRWCGLLIEMVSQYDIKPLLVTARKSSIKIKNDTIWWLRRYFNVFPPENIYWVRKEDDFRPDTELKEKCLINEILPKYSVIFAVDDRESIAQVYRRHGIPTLVCSSWENDANRHDTQA